MKKIIALACMITCIFGFTACGSEKEIPAYEQEILDYEQDKLEKSKVIAEWTLSYLVEFMPDSNLHFFDKYTAEETAYIVAADMKSLTNYELEVDGYAMKTAIISFNSAGKAIGTVQSYGEPTAVVDGKTIVVKVPVYGSLKEAEAELIFSNDGFMRLESAALNEKATMSDMMTKAALNTLIGMGTVFIVLILISLIIAAFGIIPKLQAWAAKRGKEEETKIESIDKSIDNTIAQIVEKEDVTDDFELVAVIAAAIAASEGQTSTDGFVVRSIRKVNRRR